MVESLKDYTGLMLPFFFTTIADTKLVGVRRFAKQDALHEHWELMELCLEYNLRHLKELHRLYWRENNGGPGCSCRPDGNKSAGGHRFEQVSEENETRGAAQVTAPMTC